MRLTAVALILTGLFFSANTALANDTPADTKNTNTAAEQSAPSANTDEKTQQPTRWGSKQIKSSHELLTPKRTFSDTPIFKSNPQNIFVVNESGTKHINVIDGDNFEVIARFSLNHDSHSDAKFSPNGRFVYFSSRDGWVSKYDIYNLTLVAEIRVGLNTRNIAVSSDGRWVLAGNYMPGNLVILNANDLSYADSVPTIGQEGTHSTVGGVYNSKVRNSFIIALKDTPEIWELAYGASSRVTTRPKRIFANDILDEFSLTPDNRYLLAASRKAHGAQVVDIHVAKPVTGIEIPGMPHLSSGTYWQHGNDLLFASPNTDKNMVSIINTTDWQVIKEIETQGPGMYVSTHDNVKHLWADVFFGPHNDTITLIDKETLQVAHTLKPIKGKKSANVAFTHDGKYALVSIWDADGAIVVYDTETLEIVKTIAMNTPTGKYNVGNTIGAKVSED